MGKPRPYPKLTEKQVEKFWSKIDMTGGCDACWPWIAKAKSGAGRGLLRVNKQMLAAPRVAYEQKNGPVPLDLLVYQSCLNNACCNPAHLIAGTQSEAQAYAWAAEHGPPMTDEERKLKQRVESPTTGAKPYPWLEPHEVERFWSYVEKKGPDDCWLWQSARFTQGYGAFKIAGRVLRANRLAYILTYGSISVDEVVRHSCDNPPCCNPKHLKPGSQIDNAADRETRGERCANDRRLG